MIEILAIVLAAVAGLWDLRTTEVPDDIPYLMTTIGLAYWFVTSVATGNMQPFITSLFVGTAVLFVGLVLYSKGKWGGADAWILAAIFYMVPVSAGQIILTSYLVNFFVVAIVYMAAYTVVLGAKRHIFSLFFEELKNSSVFVSSVTIAYLLFSVVIVSVLAVSFWIALSMVIFVFLMMLFWVYAKVIEKSVFIRKIKSSQLKIGDVLFETKWIGVTEKEIASLRKTNKYVTIKDGVRFVPVFSITLVITLLYGNLLFLIV